MQTSVDISTKSDIVSFIVFKRRLRQQIKRISYVLIAFLFICFLLLCIYKRQNISNFFSKSSIAISKIVDVVFTVKVNKVRVHLDKNSIIDDAEVDDIIAKLSGDKISKEKMKKIVADIMENNKFIENVYIRKTLANGELSVHIKEKKVIGVFYDDECLKQTNCAKSIITVDNQIIPYHKMKNDDNILKIYGKIGVVDLSKVHKVLKKYGLLEKIAHIQFYTSGRFDLVLKNKLLIKLPSANWTKAIQQFNKLDSEFLLSTDIQSIKYIDLRVADKVFIGSK